MPTRDGQQWLAREGRASLPEVDPGSLEAGMLGTTEDSGKGVAETEEVGEATGDGVGEEAGVVAVRAQLKSPRRKRRREICSFGRFVAQSSK
jgi:hypothetical protein